jgi:predicted dehydrogenase
MKSLRVAIIGYKFMGKAHTFGFLNAPIIYGSRYRVVPKVMCGRNATEVQNAASQFGWEETETDWRRVIDRPDVDLIDVSSPGDTHKDIVLAAAQAGKDILCEKPLANTLAEAKEMLAAVSQAGVKHMVGFNFRRLPSVALAKEMIEEGRLGRICHWRAAWLSDWIMTKEFPLVWRLQRDKAGAFGALADIGSHIIDLAQYLVGDIQTVSGAWETFSGQRPLEDDPTRMGLVTVPDAAIFLVRFKNGALGTFEATRYAAGNKDKHSFEINGEKGSLRFDYSDANKLDYFSWDDPERIGGFKSIYTGAPQHTYAGGWWPNGHFTHYGETFVSEMYELVSAIQEDRRPEPGFEIGVKCQAVVEAVAKSIHEQRWVSVDELL